MVDTGGVPNRGVAGVEESGHGRWWRSDRRAGGLTLGQQLGLADGGLVLDPGRCSPDRPRVHGASRPLDPRRRGARCRGGRAPAHRRGAGTWPRRARRAAPSLSEGVGAGPRCRDAGLGGLAAAPPVGEAHESGPTPAGGPAPGRPAAGVTGGRGRAPADWVRSEPTAVQSSAPAPGRRVEDCWSRRLPSAVEWTLHAAVGWYGGGPRGRGWVGLQVVPAAAGGLGVAGRWRARVLHRVWRWLGRGWSWCWCAERRKRGVRHAGWVLCFCFRFRHDRAP